MSIRPPLRLILMGTSPFAVPALRRLHAGPHRIEAVYTQPPRPAGRGMKERPSPVHEAALELGLPVLTPASFKTEAALAEFTALAADLAIVAAYGLILPRPVLSAPRLGCINLHGSNLPRWRGAAPIQRAIMAGDATTGVDIFQMEAGLDTGPVLASRTVTIGPHETAGFLHDRLAAIAADMLPSLLEGLANGTAQAIPQPSQGATYASKIQKDEGAIDFGQSAIEIDRRIRGLTPWPGCFAYLGKERLGILAAEPVAGSGEPGTVIELPLTVACGEGALRITSVQPAGKRPMPAEAFARGRRLGVSDRLACRAIA
ncbi:methionyl-tRNA formyltransferase [Arboricoccus pini]|uniref:Methionyl-tRNA formyltransferase n=1 Tax=Arboricoccus pini TaxID=1963835 RepID=A0A212QXK6_9PROT|nr:methionyl-tRNA formyltransferase [Arboricoccus pini]SNB64361.1 methionyl-tRNA formyltransferase [Arboricoccus pini]